jgi:hypothetical protein
MYEYSLNRLRFVSLLKVKVYFKIKTTRFVFSLLSCLFSNFPHDDASVRFKFQTQTPTTALSQFLTTTTMMIVKTTIDQSIDDRIDDQIRSREKSKVKRRDARARHVVSQN